MRRHQRSRFDVHLSFLRAFLERPLEVASITPSSRFLERRLVSLAEVSSTQRVVELGPGPGGTTEAILQALAPSARMLAIELTPCFAKQLRNIDDARLQVHEGNAVELDRILALNEMPAPDLIISGIPFSAMDRRTARCLLEQVHAALVPGGQFVAYQIRNTVEDFSRDLFGTPRVVREFRNIPPLRLYQWRKLAVPSPMHGRPASSATIGS